MYNFSDTKLVEKYGSWVRVQVEFYDFLFETANKLCATHFNQISVFAEVFNGGYKDGSEVYEKAVKAIEKHFPSFEGAWEQFYEKEIIK